MKNKIILLTIAIAAVLYGCQDIIEINLSHKSVSIIAPLNNTVTSNSSQLFIWDEVKGADHYQLQIVRPDFATLQQFIVDTNVYTTQFTFSLQPGTYQWRLRAKNNSSQTEYVTYNLKIDSTLNLSGQTVTLTSPADNFYTNSYIHTFTWQTLSNATNYVFQILSSGSVINTQSTTGTTASYTFTAEGTYQWRVFAQDASSSSNYSTRNIYIDMTSPPAPTLTFPLANDTASNPVMLAWNSDLSSVNDSVLVYSDTN
ncbi:MAG: hypothetical protein ACXVEB_15120, partial [Bacteroidia bacterium]